MGAPGRWGCALSHEGAVGRRAGPLPASSPARPDHHRSMVWGSVVMETDAACLLSALVAARPDGLWQEVWKLRRLTAGLHVFFLVVLRVWAPWPWVRLAGARLQESREARSGHGTRLVAVGPPGPGRA